MARPFKYKRKKPDKDLLQKSQFEGCYRRVTFESEDGAFKVVTFCLDDQREIKVKGNLYGTEPGERLEITGKWQENDKYGWTFSAENYKVIQVRTEEGVLAYLGSGLIKGIGPKKAEMIVERFGEKTLEILDETPELLETVPGMGHKTARKIAAEWQKHRGERETMLFLKEHGLTNALSVRLIKHYGDSVVGILRENPYQVGLEVSRVGFQKADEIAQKLGIVSDSPKRVKAAYVHLLDKATDEGHTFLLYEELIERAQEMLELDVDLLKQCLEEAVNEGFIKRTSVGDFADCYFMKSLYHCEVEVAKKLIRLNRDKKPLPIEDVDARIDRFEKYYRFSLAPQQADAVRMISRGGVVVITGGPGTGKTTLVRAVLSTLRKTGVKCALCSPTGRAAQRLAETTNREATTVHRLLKWNSEKGRFHHDETEPMEYDLYIVDESSMLDIPLAYSLLRAVRAESTVVFVGDVDQLPSVGPGMFLRDLIDSGRINTVRLEVIFRQAEASAIIRNSHRINEGRMIDTKNSPESDFFFVEREEPEEIHQSMLTLVRERIPKKINGNPIEDTQILTPMRKGPLGVTELNRILQNELNPSGQVISAHLGLRQGDKVIQNVNNYDLDVYNGDVGRIIGTHPETRETIIEFGKRRRHYPPDQLDQLELAYAITIHKSQGSEYGAALIIMTMSHFIMLKRNLIYTAVTRGKKLVVILSSKRALMKAIKTGTESERRTALRYWLVHQTENSDLFD